MSQSEQVNFHGGDLWSFVYLCDRTTRRITTIISLIKIIKLEGHPSTVSNIPDNPRQRNVVTERFSESFARSYPPTALVVRSGLSKAPDIRRYPRPPNQLTATKRIDELIVQMYTGFMAIEQFQLFPKPVQMAFFTASVAVA